MRMKVDAHASIPGRPLGDVFHKLKTMLDGEAKGEYKKAEIGSRIGVENPHTLGDWIRSMTAYGFVDKDQPGSVILTEYGCQLAHNPEMNAVDYCREAFFNVPLFRYLNEKIGMYAKDSDLKNEIRGYGIKDIYVTPALRSFKRSALFVELWDESRRNDLPIRMEQLEGSPCDADHLERLLVLYDREADRWSKRKRELVLSVASRLATNLPNNV